MATDFSFYVIIIAFASVVVSGIMLFYNKKQTDAQVLSSEMQIISTVQNNFDKSFAKIVNPEPRMPARLYAGDYLNTADNLCFLYDKKQLSFDTIKYFEHYLCLADTIRKRMISKKIGEKDFMEKSYPYFFKVWENNKFKCIKDRATNVFVNEIV